MDMIAIFGLGYAGLPLAVEFGKKYKTIGFDLSSEKVDSYKRYIDPTGDISEDDLRAASNLTVMTDLASPPYIIFNFIWSENGC